MTGGELLRLYQLGQQKQAGPLNLLYRLAGGVVKHPINLLFGRPAKIGVDKAGRDVFSRVNYKPWTGWRHASPQQHAEAARLGRRVGKVGEEHLIKKRAPGGLAGVFVKHPVYSVLGVATANEALRARRQGDGFPTPEEAVLGRVRQRVFPMAMGSGSATYGV